MAAESVTSPDGRLQVIITDEGGLRYRVETAGKTLLRDSRLGLAFQDGTKLGPAAVILGTSRTEHDGSWENAFGKRRLVRDHWREMRLSLAEKHTEPSRRFGLIVRAYDDGVAFRYDLPVESGLGEFVLTQELTEFSFTDDARCWLGTESPCAESLYPAMPLSKIPSVTADKKRAGQPFRGVLPLLVETDAGYVAVAEADLLDWAGMFLAGNGSATVAATLAPRTDGRGAVVSQVPRVSPWRVLMIGTGAAQLIDSDLIANLSTACRLPDVSWVKPGVAAWDAWWTGVNPTQPLHTGLDARGDTRSHEEYIDFAAEMGWPYQVVDWFWYQDDPTQPLPHVDMPAVFAHAAGKRVKLFVWLHSKEVRRLGAEKIFALLKGWGAVGAKIDFMDSDSQETVRWYAETLETAARYHLMVDFHGAYKPTGLARTYPNFITQEGVLGNEYNKIAGSKCTPLHTATLPFTRGLLGPMDFTPGGFLNRAPDEFKITSPTQVMGTRARQLAMTVIYVSPLLVLCDSPANYRGQPGVEFLRGLPTVWDDTRVLAADVGKTIAIARRSVDRWYLAAMNSEDAATLRLPLSFLGEKNWQMRVFTDSAESHDYQAITEKTEAVASDNVLTVPVQPVGGFAAILSPVSSLNK